MTPLPQDIEEAINTLKDRVHGWHQNAHGLTEISKATRTLRAVIATHIHPEQTQRQRYKEAAMKGMLAHPDRPFRGADFAAEIGNIADDAVAEDAEHAGRDKP